jgi:hypothetical protein
MSTVDLLEVNSLFLWIATPEEIEAERQAMEAEHKCCLAVYDVNYETRSGARVTRVVWQRG